MRRLLSSLLLALVATMFLAVFALPGFATEAEAPAETTEHAEDEADDHAEDEADDHAEDDDHAEEGEGQWTGLMAAFVAGILMGGIGFFSAGTEGLDGHGDDH